jgi:hypothetical protein
MHYEIDPNEMDLKSETVPFDLVWSAARPHLHKYIKKWMNYTAGANARRI